MAQAKVVDKPDLPTPEEIADALYRADITKFPGWERAAALSSDTRVQSVIVLPDIIIWKGETFKCSFNVCLEFTFDDGLEPTSFSADFPAGFEGHVEDGKPVIDRIAINTKSFYR